MTYQQANADSYMRLVLVEPPAVEPITAAEAKSRLGIGDEVSDETMDACITAARQTIDGADGWLNRALITQTWSGTLDCFPSGNGKLYVPFPPLQELTVSYVDEAGETVAMEEGVDYRLVKAVRPYIVPIGSQWPASITDEADAITLEFVVGYGDSGTDVPEAIRTAIVLGAGAISSLTTRRLDVSLEREEGIGETRYNATNVSPSVTINEAAKSLLSTYRVIVV